MKSFSAGILLLLSLLFPPTTSAEGPGSRSLDLVTKFLFVPDTVTTEQIGDLDPSEMNPHRARWVLHRKLQIKGLEAVEGARGSFVIRAPLIESHATGKIRGPGPWFRSEEEFPCTAEPQAWYATEKGARVAAEAAGSVWSELLRDEKPKLELALSRIHTNSRELALSKALREFDQWNRSLEDEWRFRHETIRAKEWSFYRATAQKSGECKSGRKIAPVRWEQMMEPVSTNPPTGKALAIAPARRWGELFSVRLNVEIGSKVLNGQFLIDSGAARSSVSPSWLEGQGAVPELLEAPGGKILKTNWSWGSALGRATILDRVVMSGLPLDIQEFVLFDPDFFFPPDYAASCCDGILGADFLRKYVVEFVIGKPNEVRIWPKQDFRPAPRVDQAETESTWFETHLSPRMEILSDCQVSDSKYALKGVRWMTGLDGDLVTRSKVSGTDWNLYCDRRPVALRLAPEAPEPESVSNFQTYSAEIGMPVLARGPFVFDLPHGRVWFSKRNLEGPVFENHTGLGVGFEMIKGDRVLKVLEIKNGSPAALLVKHGLHRGTAILEIDSRPVEEMDHWEVERRLSGFYGDRLTLKWIYRKVIKIAPLKLR